MKLKPVPKAILIAVIVGGLGYGGFIFMPSQPTVVQTTVPVQPVQAPAAQPAAPVVQAPAAQPAAPEVRQDMSANRGMSALMTAGKK